MQDMVTGLVKQNLNKEHKNMVLVEYRLAEGGTMEMDWMPVMMPYGGPGYGLIPDAGNRDRGGEGLRFGDRSKPFVMGALLEDMDSVPEAGGTGNIPARMLKTRTGFTVSVDEDRMGSCLRTRLDRIKWPSLLGRTMGVWESHQGKGGNPSGRGSVSHLGERECHVCR